LTIKERGGFVAQAAWLSIGYSVGAATGIKCARPDKRIINIVGDGAFHETCQAVSDHTAYGHNTVVFVMSNGIYGIEQYLVNPNPYRGANKVDYPGREGSLLNDFYPYNKLPRWDFVKLAEGFGAIGKKVTNEQELEDVWKEIEKAPGQNFVVEVVIPANASPKAIANASVDAVGEDEICNPHWPPSELF
jgi:indolepyruvate decarboxylase